MMGSFHVIPLTISDTQELAIRNLRDRAACVNPDPYSSRIHLTSPGVSGLRDCPSQGFGGFFRPVLTAWALFSAGVTHSRFLTLLFLLTPSMWFTWLLGVGGPPRNASATNLWTTFLAFFRNPLSGGMDRVIQLYPAWLQCCPIILPGSTRSLPERPLAVVPSLPTRPRSLTSYRPSKPTTGSHFSSSISNLSSGLLASLRSVTNSVTSGSSGTAPVPSVSALRQRHLVGLPTTGAFPVSGLGCRS